MGDSKPSLVYSINSSEFANTIFKGKYKINWYTVESAKTDTPRSGQPSWNGNKLPYM